MNLKAAKAIFGVFFGCMLNMAFLELLVKNDPGIGNVTTFSQFLFISIYGFIFVSKFGTTTSKIPKYEYFWLVSMFFLVNVMNNIAFNYKIPVPLHIIFRSGSLIANMLLGIWILKKSYTFLKYLSVIMITLGIIICTLLSSDTSNDQSPDNFFWWAIGITILSLALLISARMGIEQERLSSRFGKNPMESMYYTHLFSLPGFLTVAGDLAKYWYTGLGSPYYESVLGTFSIQWIYLIGNVVSQLFCIASVYTLTTECSSLTVTLVLTLRKFASLMFSIIYFQNPFSAGHCLGAILVFVGTIIFTEIPQKYFASLQKKEKAT